MRSVRVLAAGLAVGLAALLAGCGGGPEIVVTPTATPQPTATAEPEPEPTLDPWISLIATAESDSVEVYADPADATAERTVTAAEAVSLPNRIPMTFLVIEQREDWLHVYLPIRPNGASGWIRADAVALATTDFRVEVRLSEHRLLLHRAQEVVLDVPVGIGRAEVPTPGGTYYIKELLQPPEPGGVYGAYAYGLSGYSPVLESFAGGQGVIGIHGTNEPELVGTDVSHGCIRMVDADVTRLVEEFGLPLGTPVEIVE
jgi:lipoprotein-anchoring transpeptidase ErfK/SrfK